ncbi:MAG: aspartate 1-decarboxylase [Candidatus Omnitrophota bacterium]
MLRRMCKSKIAGAKVTEAQVHYEGSITIDDELLKAVDILPGEKVEVLNLNNGSRIETYAISGEKGSGVICLNGAAAHSGKIGDGLIILAYCLVEDKQARDIKLRFVKVNEKNRISR